MSESITLGSLDSELSVNYQARFQPISCILCHHCGSPLNRSQLLPSPPAACLQSPAAAQLPLPAEASCITQQFAATLSLTSSPQLCSPQLASSRRLRYLVASWLTASSSLIACAVDRQRSLHDSSLSLATCSFLLQLHRRCLQLARSCRHLTVAALARSNHW